MTLPRSCERRPGRQASPAPAAAPETALVRELAASVVEFLGGMAGGVVRLGLAPEAVLEFGKAFPAASVPALLALCPRADGGVSALSREAVGACDAAAEKWLAREATVESLVLVVLGEMAGDEEAGQDGRGVIVSAQKTKPREVLSPKRRRILKRLRTMATEAWKDLPASDPAASRAGVLDEAEEEAKMRSVLTLFDNATGMFLWGLMVPLDPALGGGHHTFLTRGVKTVFGLTPEEVLADESRMHAQLNEEQIAARSEMNMPRIRAGEPVDPFTITLKDGRVLKLQMTEAWRNEEWVYVVGITEDSPTSRSMRSLHDQMSTTQGLFLYELIVVVNPAVARMDMGHVESMRFLDVLGDVSPYAFEREELLAMDPFVTLVHPAFEDRFERFSAVVDRERDGTWHVFNGRAQRKSSAPPAKLDLESEWDTAKNGVPVEIHMKVVTRMEVTGPDGQKREKLHIIGLDRYRDKEVKAELQTRKLHARQARSAADLSHLIYTANAPILGVDTEGAVYEWNRKIEQVTGFAKADVVGRPLLDYVVPARRAAVSKVLADALAGVDTEHFSLQLQSRSGTVVEALMNAATRRDAQGRATGVFGVGQDITERLKWFQQIQTVLHRSTDAIAVHAPDSCMRILKMIASACARVFDVTPEALEGGSLLDLCHPDDQEKLREVFRILSRPVHTDAAPSAPRLVLWRRLPPAATSSRKRRRMPVGANVVDGLSPAGPLDGLPTADAGGLGDAALDANVRWLESSFSGESLEDGNFISITRDVTDRVRLQEAEMELARKEVARKKDMEVARFTRHEVKNGILSARARLKAQMELLRAGEGSLEEIVMDDATAGPHHNVQALRRRLQALDAELHHTLETVLHDAMVRELIHGSYAPFADEVSPEALHALIDRGTLPLVIRFMPEPFPTLRLDGRLLGHVLMNAISNAGKYGSADAPIVVTCQYGAGRLDMKPRLEIVVRNAPGADHGALLAADPSKVFAKGVRLHASLPTMSRDVNSARSQGDGGWIMRKCADALGGDCSIRFLPDATEFLLQCPAALVLPEDIADSFALPPNCHLLAVDDSRVQLILMRGIFKEQIDETNMLLRGRTIEEILQFPREAISYIQRTESEQGRDTASSIGSIIPCVGSSLWSSPRVMSPSASARSMPPPPPLRPTTSSEAMDLEASPSLTEAKVVSLGTLSGAHPPFYLLVLDQNLSAGPSDRSGAGGDRQVLGTDLAKSITASLQDLAPHILKRTLVLVRSANDSRQDLELYDGSADGFLPKTPMAFSQLRGILCDLWVRKFGTLPASSAAGSDEGSLLPRGRYVVPATWTVSHIDAYLEEMGAYLELIRADLEGGRNEWTQQWQALHVIRGNTQCLAGNTHSPMDRHVDALRGYSHGKVYPPRDVWDMHWAIIEAECERQTKVLRERREAMVTSAV